jgi:phosphatidylserine/phosphatidylglycerophosphate/cardiolipin synthase-like enzyme
MLDRVFLAPSQAVGDEQTAHGEWEPHGAGEGFVYLQAGRNCPCLVTARRAAVLIDGAEYFWHLRSALLAARRSILIVGWDFDARIRLCPADRDETLGEFLRSCVETRPDLEIRILLWGFGVVHGPGAALPLLVGAPWRDHPRIQVVLDNKHPIYGAQHQKIVCIDDSLAFVGGIDLTVDRWDTPEHTPDDPLRITPDGDAYPPVHDVQIAIDGEAARAVANVARRRWTCATDEELASLPEEDAVWPDGLTPEFLNVPVGIACTLTEWSNKPEYAVERMTVDIIARATRVLYIETQYLTAANVERQLRRRLAEPDGPEIVILQTEIPPGRLERLVMGNNADRMLRRLKRCDRHDRLRVYYPVIAGEQDDVEIKMHAKLMIADDNLVKIGSSNLNNRSMGVDSECDVAIEAQDDDTRYRIRRLRERLLAEHLGTTVEVVATAVQREGSLIRALERLNSGGARRLCTMRALLCDGPRRPLPFTWLLDPARPLALGERLKRWWRSLRAHQRQALASDAGRRDPPVIKKLPPRTVALLSTRRNPGMMMPSSSRRAGSPSRSL